MVDINSTLSRGATFPAIGLAYTGDTTIMANRLANLFLARCTMPNR